MPEPVGSIRLVECGPGALAELKSLRDSSAAFDTNDCDAKSRMCVSDHSARSPYVGVAIRVIKEANGSWQLNGSACTRATRAQVTGAMVLAQAKRLVPSAAVGLAPHGSTLVNIETVMWAEAPASRTLPAVTLLGRTVVISLKLDSVAWDYGDGASDPNGPPGKPYDATNDPCRLRQCTDYDGHTYLRTGPVTVTAVARWRASFTIDGGAPQD
ncbi:MAG: hypothetical protein ACR2LX_00450, partial [Jatrophihabitans sp.]